MSLSTAQKSNWPIVALATFSLIVSNGLAIGGLPPFYKPMRDELTAAGVIAAAGAESFIANCANITFIMSGVFSLLGGWLSLRFRLRPLMAAGCVLLGGGMLLHAWAAAPFAIYSARALMGASLGFIGVAPCVVLISRWFDSGRGTALGVALMGTSIGGTVIPPLASPLIANFGWRIALAGLSVVIWLVLLPLILLVVREPERDHTEPKTHGSQDGMTLAEALRKPTAWVFGLCAALVFYPIFVTSQQFILYLQTPQIGVSAAAASWTQSLLFAVSIGGKVLAGLTSDRTAPSKVMAVCAAIMFAASLVLLQLNSANFLFFLVPFALGYGGTFVLLQRLGSELFGKRDIGRILGAVTLVEVFGAAVGGRVTGYLADKNGGDYTFAFYGVTVAAGLAFVCALIIAMADRRSAAA